MRQTEPEQWTRTMPRDAYDRGMSRSTGTIADILRILLAILLPPLGVFLQVGFRWHFWLNILLTLLGYIPGIIHALYVVLRY